MMNCSWCKTLPMHSPLPMHDMKISINWKQPKKQVEKTLVDLKQAQAAIGAIRKNGFAWVNSLPALHMRYKTR